jgi:hypothetical protein
MDMEELKFKLQRLAEDAGAGRPGAMDNAAAAYEHASDLVKQVITRRDAEQAERNLPIDEEWLRSIGAQKHAINRWSFPHFNLWIYGARKEWCVKLHGHMTVFVTRGQLLKLIDLFNLLEGGAT